MMKQAAGHGLLFMVLFILPIGSLSYSGQHPHADHHRHRSSFRRVLIGHDSDKYAVIFDAGSTGSRVHVFRFDENQDLLPIGNELELYVSTKPGLSSYAADPQAAASSLRPLLEKAEAVVPVWLQPDTPARLGATAGLRLVKGDAAEKILDAVRNLFKNESHLKYKHDWVSILDGSQEGTYMWVTINYLLNTLGKSYAETVATIDLGGASVQMAYAVSDENAANAPQVAGNETYLLRKNLKGTNYNLYVHRCSTFTWMGATRISDSTENILFEWILPYMSVYLSYGSKAARAEIFKASRNSTNPCILEGYEGTYTYGGVVYKVAAPRKGTNMKRCQILTRKALKINAPCKYDSCTFNGIWNGGGGAGEKNLYLSSSFYWTALDSGILKQNATAGRILVNAYQDAAKRACATKFSDVKSKFPNVQKDNIPYLCMDLVYIYTLLVDGFDLNASQTVEVVNEVKYKNSQVEASWPLGCAIDVTSSLTSKTLMEEI